MNENHESNEEWRMRILKTKSLRVKKKLKGFTPKSATKNVEKVKHKCPIKRPLKKKKRVEENVVKKKSLKRKLVQTNDSETNGVPYVMDIVTSSRRNIRGKRIPVNIPAALLDNVSFHSEVSVQKWKYVF